MFPLRGGSLASQRKVKFKIDGNRASAIPDEMEETKDTAEVMFLSGELIRNGGQWKINMDGLEEYKDYPLDEVGDSAPIFYLCTRGLKVMDGLLTDVEAGKFGTWEEYQRAESELTERVRTQVEKDLKAAETRPAKK